MKKLIERQVSNKINSLNGFPKAAAGVSSWVNYIRKALGMTLTDLARRADVSPPTVHKLEKAEIEGRVTLASLKKMAAAMDCELVYAILPRTSIREIRHKQAEKKAQIVLKEVQVHMEIEDQAVQNEEFEEQFRDLVEEFLQSKKLWRP